MGGEVLLVVGEHADPVAAAARKQLVHPAASQGDQHQRGPKRDRQEAVGGHAVNDVFFDRGDDRDAGGEPAHDLAELPRRLLDRTRLGSQPGYAGLGQEVCAVARGRVALARLAGR